MFHFHVRESECNCLLRMWDRSPREWTQKNMQKENSMIQHDPNGERYHWSDLWYIIWFLSMIWSCVSQTELNLWLTSVEQSVRDCVKKMKSCLVWDTSKDWDCLCGAFGDVCTFLTDGANDDMFLFRRKLAASESSSLLEKTKQNNSTEIAWIRSLMV